MKLYNITFSPTGGTQKVADIIADTWNCEKVNCDLLSPAASLPAITAEDLCILSVPSFGGRVPDAAVNKIKELQGNQAKTILVAVYGNRAFEDTLLELKDTAESVGFHCVAAIAAIAEHSIFRQFASGRPNADDKKELQDFAAQIKDKLDTLSSVTVPGNHPYREYNGVPLKPKANRKCTNCKLCAKACPVGAISTENPKLTDKEKCISCMHCISVCPANARGNSKLLLAFAGNAMKKKCSEYLHNELFIS